MVNVPPGAMFFGLTSKALKVGGVVSVAATITRRVSENPLPATRARVNNPPNSNAMILRFWLMTFLQELLSLDLSAVDSYKGCCESLVNRRTASATDENNQA